MEDFQTDTQPIYMLLARLERISADSYWAHRASGVRGGLLRMLDNIENARPVQKPDLDRLTDLGFEILKRAAQEVAE